MEDERKIKTIISGYALLCSHIYVAIDIQNKRQVYSLASQRRNVLKRLSWRSFCLTTHDKQFRRMFRMSKSCFEKLCASIIKAVGESSFKSEEFLDVNYHQMSVAHNISSGGSISGEVKLASTLRMLAGASYLDVEKIFHLSFGSAGRVFKYVLCEWVCNDNVIKINFNEYMENDDAMNSTSQDFACGGSDTIISGCIGALDGWLVKIRSPSQKRDQVRNPGHYYSRKGFFALNVQVIVDKKKSVIWRCINSRGGAHDSSAFKNSSLYGKMEGNWMNLVQKGFYLLGDSAYALKSFLLTPYNNAKPSTPEDTFNFYHSSCRIYVECAFGEIDMRWGIFWRPLGHKLTTIKYIIDGAMRLHNFIVDYRIKHGITDTSEMDDFQSECLEFCIQNPDYVTGTFGDGVNAGNVGHPSANDQILRDVGKNIRNSIKDKLAHEGFHRPTYMSWRRTDTSHITMN